MQPIHYVVVSVHPSLLPSPFPPSVRVACGAFRFSLRVVFLLCVATAFVVVIIIIIIFFCFCFFATNSLRNWREERVALPHKGGASE